MSMEKRKFIVLMIYDIVDNKMRNKMVKCLEQYGVRVQKSAFEALLDRKQYQRLLAESSVLIDEETDSLRVYILDDIIDVYTWGIGERRETDCIVL